MDRDPEWTGKTGFVYEFFNDGNVGRILSHSGRAARAGLRGWLESPRRVIVTRYRWRDSKRRPENQNGDPTLKSKWVYLMVVFPISLTAAFAIGGVAPMLTKSSYTGGDVTRDDNVFVVGYTESDSFDGELAITVGLYDAFITELDLDGTRVNT